MDKFVTTFKQKIILILLGLLLGIVLLEIGLRVGGFVLSYLQERSNRDSLRRRHSYVVMCLGESTTALGGANAYPRQLELVLNDRLPGITVSVVNKGVGGFTTSAILDQLERNLDKYQPDVVVVMMGINDYEGLMPYEENETRSANQFWERSRVCKLALLLWDRFILRYGVLNLPGCHRSEIDAEQFIRLAESYLRMELYARAKKFYQKAIDLNGGSYELYTSIGHCCMEQDEFAEAATYFGKALELEPDNVDALMKLGNSYGGRRRKQDVVQLYDQALKLEPENVELMVKMSLGYRIWKMFDSSEMICRRALKIDPRNPEVYYELGMNYMTQGKYDDAEAPLRRAVDLAPREYRYYRGLINCLMGKEQWEEAISMGEAYLEKKLGEYRIIMTLIDCYRKLGRWDEAEALALRMIEINPKDERAYGARDFICSQQGDDDLAKARLTRGRRFHYYSATIQNYRLLRDLLTERGIQIVCVQYPLCRVEDLMGIFPDSEGIIFVDNEQVFRDAVFEGAYDDYFSDIFAGTFGHCTPRGNRLLAENIAGVLMEQYFHLRKVQ